MPAPSKPVRRTVNAVNLDDNRLSVLESMLENDERITAGAVSTLTRDTFRRDLIAHYQQMQMARNQWVERAKKNSQKRLIASLAMKDERIEDLERQVALLTASHKAIILAVGELGGLRAWQRFFSHYDEHTLMVLSNLKEPKPD
ncbi:hypothetical protein NTD90_32110 [Pseudomonas sp. 20S_6.2_Bac1]|nr:hypothetical protein [Pseudomonas sp. QS1027]MCU1742005.1 hypothetical protein [Pseudomonas sp. 20S_6.2_Bac1]